MRVVLSDFKMMLALLGGNYAPKRRINLTLN